MKNKHRLQPVQKGKKGDFCGYRYERLKEKCPIWGEICDNCKGLNHFKVKCKKIHSTSGSKNDDSLEDCWLASIASGPREVITATMQVNNCNVRFQVDSAADVNTMSEIHSQGSS